MSDLDDYRLDSESSASEESAGEAAPGSSATPATSPAPARSSSPPLVGVVAVIAALALIALGYFWFFGRQPPPPAVSPAAETAPTAPRPPTRVEGESIEEQELPPLEASDEVIRRLVGGLSENPQLAAWLVTDDLARRFVVAVDNIAEGVTPRAHLGFLAPEAEFAVDEVDGRQAIAASSYRRYDAVTAVFTSIDTPGAVRLFRRLEPLFQQAYVELGYPNRRFADTLAQALQVIIDTPRPPAEIEVVRGVESYQFADPRLESLLPIQKQLLRLGPENLERVQTKAADLAAVIGP